MFVQHLDHPRASSILGRRNVFHVISVFLRAALIENILDSIQTVLVCLLLAVELVTLWRLVLLVGLLIAADTIGFSC